MKAITFPKEVIDHKATGRAMRAFRTGRKVSLRRTARHAGISAAYLSSLELGSRRWTDSLCHRVTQAVRAAKEGR